MKPLQVVAVCLAVIAILSWLQLATDLLLLHSGHVSVSGVETSWREVEAMVGSAFLIWFLHIFPFFPNRE